MLILLAGNAFAQEDDRAAVLALMDRAFEAVSSADPDDWRAIQLAEGTSISFRSRANGTPGELEMRMRTNEAEAVASSHDRKIVQPIRRGRPNDAMMQRVR
ncbi:MAG TPA: hypothetical protein VMO47_10730 [Rhodothermales bacterium]|nr:hypothetical protein [Rhodothermales bacterium]